MTKTTRMFAGALVVLLAVGASSMHGMRAQKADPPLPAPPAAAAPAEAPALPSQADDAMATCRQMMAAVRATDARLERLVAEMQAATGDAKVAVMADLLAALVEDRMLMRHPSVATVPATDTGHRVTTPSRAQGAGLIARGQMQELMESLSAQSAKSRHGPTDPMSWCASLLQEEGTQQRENR